MKKILLVGGGTGGHIMPLLAVADEIIKLGGRNIRLDYIGPRSRFFGEFEKRGIRTHSVVQSKMRRYLSAANVVDGVKFVAGFFESVGKISFIRPHVLFSKGGPGALAVVLAAWVCGVPIIVHESDTVPGVTNRTSAKFAKKIIIAFPEAARYFDEGRTLVIGNPVRPAVLEKLPDRDAARAAFGLSGGKPVVFVVGGSQGAQRMNKFIVDNLGSFSGRFQIIHQAGAANVNGLPEESDGYKPFGFMDTERMKEAYVAADAIVSRAGASSIAEIAAFGKPSIIIPLPAEIVGEHQILNARAYAASGAAVVIEEKDLTLRKFSETVAKILDDGITRDKMSYAAKAFAKPEAAKDIARKVLEI